MDPPGLNYTTLSFSGDAPLPAAPRLAAYTHAALDKRATLAFDVPFVSAVTFILVSTCILDARRKDERSCTNIIRLFYEIYMLSTHWWLE